MMYGRSVRKALDTFDLDHNKWPELAADRLAWRVVAGDAAQWEVAVRPASDYRVPPSTPAALPIALTRPKRPMAATTTPPSKTPCSSLLRRRGSAWKKGKEEKGQPHRGHQLLGGPDPLRQAIFGLL